MQPDHNTGDAMSQENPAHRKETRRTIRQAARTFWKSGAIILLSACLVLLGCFLLAGLTVSRIYGNFWIPSSEIPSIVGFLKLLFLFTIALQFVSARFMLTGSPASGMMAYFLCILLSTVLTAGASILFGAVFFAGAQLLSR